MPSLKYVGGDRWVAGWPASDHEDTDASRVQMKVSSGLYVIADEPAEKQKKAGESQ